MNDELKSSSLIVHHSASTSLLGLRGWGPKFQRPSESKDVKWGSQTIYSDFDGKNGTNFQEPDSKKQDGHGIWFLEFASGASYTGRRIKVP